ncbi:MAG TPA: hypothetical protein VEI95_02385 [Acidobacteriota bacterium]|nr:hypothetical protein [Acidobacteriota bacterium]
MTRPIESQTDEATIRNELEGYIKASGSDVSEQMRRAQSTMDLYFMHGQWACTNDLPEKAIRSFKTCLRFEPNAPIIHCALSRIYLTRGDLAKADRHARRVLELEPYNFKNILTCHLIVSKLNRDPRLQDRLSLSIRSRIATVAKSLGTTAPAWPWGRHDVASAWGDEALRSACAEFKARKFTVLRNVLPAGWPELLRAEQSELLARGNMSLETTMHRYVTVDAPMASVANYQIASSVARVAGQGVIPTYSFAIHYVANGHIKPHVDRPQNELSMSLSLSVTPSGRDVSVLRAGPADSMDRLDLKPNDALLYRGAEVTHSRDPVPGGHTVDQAIFGFRTVHKSHCYCI